MVGDKAAAAVVLLGRLGARHAQAIDEVEELVVALGEIRDLRRPVVHLEVDVDRELAVPGRLVALVPDPLEICRQRPRATRSEEQVAPELEVELGQAGIIGARLDALEAGVRRKRLELGIGMLGKPESDTAHERAMTLDVPGTELVVRHRRRGVEHLDARPLGIARSEVGRRADDDRDCIRVTHRDVVSDQLGHATLGQHTGARVEARSAFGHAAADHVIRSLESLERVIAPVVVRADLDRAGPIGREAQDDDVVGNAREDLAPEARPPELVLDGGDAVVEVERAPVAGHELLVVAAEQQRHVAEHLVARLPVRHPEHRELRQRLRFLDLAVQQQPTYLGELAERVGVVPVVGPTRPDALLVEDERLLVDASEDGRAEAPVPDRERGEPARSRLVVPESRAGAVGHRGVKVWSSPGSLMVAMTSSGRKGTKPVKFSIPSSVTATVSSTRM